MSVSDRVWRGMLEKKVESKCGKGQGDEVPHEVRMER